MGQRKYPPLTPREIESILKARGFEYERSHGDHNYYVRDVKGSKRLTQVDTGVEVYGSKLIKMVVEQSGMTREQFYASTKSTAKKIGVKRADKDELENWADSPLTPLESASASKQSS